MGKDCKINFYTLIQKMWKKKNEDPDINNPFNAIDDLATFITSKRKTDRFIDLKNGKFCFIDSVHSEIDNPNSKLLIGVFKSARNEFRPNLINKTNGNERPNPKAITEGDVEKTHFIIKIDSAANEVYLFLENNYHGVNIENFINYLSIFNKPYLHSIGKKQSYSIKFTIIPKDNFLNELQNMQRTRIAEVYFDKQLLGGKALNFSNRLVSIRKDLKLVATAEKRESIKEVAIDCYNALNKQGSGVTKVRVMGNDENNNEVVLDTSFIAKIEFLNIDTSIDTGEFNSIQFQSELKRIANSF